MLLFNIVTYENCERYIRLEMLAGGVPTGLLQYRIKGNGLESLQYKTHKRIRTRERVKRFIVDSSILG